MTHATRWTLIALMLSAAMHASAAPLNADDKTFLADASVSNQKEIDVSKYATEHATSAKVKSFAQTMVRDHTKLGAEMAKLNDGSVSPPPPGSPPSDLTSKSGADFDKAYIDQMVSDHDATVAKFQATASGKQYSAPVRAAANKALPTIRHHDAMAKTLAGSLGK